MTKEKILKIKVGDVYNPVTKESLPVFKTARRRVSKTGVEYWVCEEQIFVNEFEKKEKAEAKPRATL